MRIIEVCWGRKCMLMNSIAWCIWDGVYRKIHARRVASLSLMGVSFLIIYTYPLSMIIISV